MDALAARHAKTVLADFPRAAWLGTIASRISSGASERQQNIDWALSRVDSSLVAAARRGYRVITCLDTDYPELLRHISDPPVVVWSRGQEAVLQTPAVAIVGSRDATPASLAVARTLGRGIAEAGLTVVSGLARGVDAAAHAGALEGGGLTIAVLGSGLDRLYPRRHTGLADQIAQSGAVITELPPDALPFPWHFPLRNRIISGLCRATVVVEASERSGSLITARMALDQGRDVLAVPGGTMSGRHRGCHGLIKDGARLVETVDDVLDEIRWPRRAGIPGPDSPNHLQLSDLEANMARGEPYTVDQLARQTGRSASELLTDLCLLELAGRVSRTAGGQFIRMAGPERVEGK
jgi:DNA processing protein